MCVCVQKTVIFFFCLVLVKSLSNYIAIYTTQNEKNELNIVYLTITKRREFFVQHLTFDYIRMLASQPRFLKGVLNGKTLKVSATVEYILNSKELTFLQRFERCVQCIIDSQQREKSFYMNFIWQQFSNALFHCYNLDITCEQCNLWYAVCKDTFEIKLFVKCDSNMAFAAQFSLQSDEFYTQTNKQKKNCW